MYKDLEALLHLDRQAVGVKLLSHADMDQYKTLPFEEVKHKAYYCWLVKKATEGRGFKLTMDQFACDTAGWVLGLAPNDHFGTPEESVNGWFDCGTYATEKVAELIAEGIKPLPNAEGVLIAPLHAFPDYLKPDVVLMLGNPYSIMRIIQSYSATQGFASQIKFSGMCGICFESTAHPIQTQSLSVSALCSGTRYFAKWGINEMAASLPYHQLSALLKGIHITLNPCEPDAFKRTIESKTQLSTPIQFSKNYFR